MNSSQQSIKGIHRTAALEHRSIEVSGMQRVIDHAKQKYRESIKLENNEGDDKDLDFES
jgi:hypothetical protein